MAITPERFAASLEYPDPPQDLPPALCALWYAVKGDFEHSHAVVADEPSREAAWVHAYLHRLEGDMANARYWYARAGRAPPNLPLAMELATIRRVLLAEAGDEPQPE